MKTTIDPWAFLRHPLVISVGAIVIAYAGYLFGQWLHGQIN